LEITGLKEKYYKQFDTTKNLLNVFCIVKTEHLKNILKNGIDSKVNKIFIERKDFNESKPWIRIPAYLGTEILNISNYLKNGANSIVVVSFGVDIENIDCILDDNSVLIKTPIEIKEGFYFIEISNNIEIKLDTFNNISFKDIPLCFDASVDSVFPIVKKYPVYKAILRTHPDEIVGEKSFLSFDFFEKIKDINKDTILFFEKIKTLENKFDEGNIINICHRDTKDPFFFLSSSFENEEYHCGIFNGTSWINRSFKLSLNENIETTQISIMFIVLKNRIMFFIKPFGEKYSPILINFLELSTLENFHNSSFFLGSANSQYRSCPIDVDRIFIYDCPKSIEKELEDFYFEYN